MMILHKTTSKLMTYHTSDLLKLLRLLREERRAFYTQLSTIKKGASEMPEYKPLAVDTGNDYENLTRKSWIVENILNDRIGYIPNKITDQLLLTVSKRMENEIENYNENEITAFSFKSKH
jgi:seryl-tRNA synthetase